MNTDFKVKELRTLNFIAGGVFALLFVMALVNIMDNYHRSHAEGYLKILLLTIIPACIFIRKGLRNKTMIVVNKYGIYRYNKLVTTWQNFITAYIQEGSAADRTTDNFLLIIEFYKDGEEGFYRKIIQLSTTRNKSEEEIIAAIEFYYQQSIRQKSFPTHH